MFVVWNDEKKQEEQKIKQYNKGLRYTTDLASGAIFGGALYLICLSGMKYDHESVIKSSTAEIASLKSDSLNHIPHQYANIGRTYAQSIKQQEKFLHDAQQPISMGLFVSTMIALVAVKGAAISEMAINAFGEKFYQSRSEMLYNKFHKKDKKPEYKCGG